MGVVSAKWVWSNKHVPPPSFLNSSRPPQKKSCMKPCFTTYHLLSLTILTTHHPYPFPLPQPSLYHNPPFTTARPLPPPALYHNPPFTTTRLLPHPILYHITTSRPLPHYHIQPFTTTSSSFTTCYSLPVAFYHLSHLTNYYLFYLPPPSLTIYHPVFYHYLPSAVPSHVLFTTNYY